VFTLSWNSVHSVSKMFHTDYLPVFQFHLKLSSHFRAHSVAWSETEGKLLTVNPKELRRHKIGIVCLVIRTCFMMWKTLEVVRSKEKDLQEKIIAGYICSAMIVATVAVISIFIQTSKICAFVNLLPYFEHRLKGRERIRFKIRNASCFIPYLMIFN